MPRADRSFLATPPGPGAIAVIRVVGPNAPAIVEHLFQPKQSPPPQPLCNLTGEEVHLHFGRLAVAGETIDEAIVSLADLEGEPVVDICSHGGVRVVERLLGALEKLGAPLGDEQDRLPAIWRSANLIAQEALDGLVQAKTVRAVRFLAWQRQHLTGRLNDVAALCDRDPEASRRAIEAMAMRYPTARILIEGGLVALVGAPNSGKSTLFNTLVGREAAIVSRSPGTTRDWVSAMVEIDGVPLTVADTAGRGGSGHELDREAVERGRTVAGQADLRLVLVDGSKPLTDRTRDLVALELQTGRAMAVLTKSDLSPAWEAPALASPEGLGREPHAARISALTGDGLDDLSGRILTTLGFDDWADYEACFFTKRQMDVAESILSDLPSEAERAQEAIKRMLRGE